MTILYFTLSAASGTASGPGFVRAAPRGSERAKKSVFHSENR